MITQNKRYSALDLVQQGIRDYLKTVDGGITADHIENTPARFVKALQEMFSGVDKKPEEALGTQFPFESKDSELIVVRDIEFVSVCAHHLLPFIGKCHFGYLPDTKIVGLSKIPRLIEVLSHRPQVQERLTRQIVDVFQAEVKPRGCGVLVSASHMCMSVRGVKQPGALTDTTALTGSFLTNPSLKQEFLYRVTGR